MSESLEEEQRIEAQLLEHTTKLNDLEVTSSEIKWLKRCLPVIAQPKIDVENHNHLVKIMYEFERDGEKNQLNCKLYVIYAGESSYYRTKKEVHNHVATLFYRSFNRKVYKRTADINYIEYRDVDLNPSSSMPWKSLYTPDHAGGQSWAQGDKGNVLCWFSLMHHYRVNLGFNEWEKHGSTTGRPSAVRPLLYLNTCNHMWGQSDNNPDLQKHYWTNYPIQAGGGQEALEFSQNHVPTKRNFYSLCCFCFARNGGGCCDRVQNEKLEHSGDSFYVLHEDMTHESVEMAVHEQRSTTTTTPRQTALL